MIKNTFLHIPGIAAKREKKLWKQGVTTWEKYEANFDQQMDLFQPNQKTFNESRDRLALRDGNYFASLLPVTEHYRIALDFPLETLFLDIETTGTGFRFDQITVVGWSLGNDYGFFIDGDDPALLIEAVNKSIVVVTFNGTSFDLPIVRRAFSDITFPSSQVDLRYFGRKLGLRGGQKKIEKLIGMNRDEDIVEMTGRFAPILWERYKRGDRESLNKLVRYNYADVYGMKVILDHLIMLNQEIHMIPIKDPYSFAKDRGVLPERFGGFG
jgi:uncharacterized protein YprB with RNaseH-like and TPR domain